MPKHHRRYGDKPPGVLQALSAWARTPLRGPTLGAASAQGAAGSSHRPAGHLAWGHTRPQIPRLMFLLPTPNSLKLSPDDTLPPTVPWQSAGPAYLSLQSGGSSGPFFPASSSPWPPICADQAARRQCPPRGGRSLQCARTAPTLCHGVFQGAGWILRWAHVRQSTRG